jgi:UDP-N-acetylmuramate dehydrogenase
MVIVAGDPDCRSAGSFFKNPVVPAEQVVKVAAAAGRSELEVPKWPAGVGTVKLPAAWLLEQAGFYKGFEMGRAAVSSKHTLALTNRGGATFAEIDTLANTIAAGVKAKFGIVLEREPVILG